MQVEIDTFEIEVIMDKIVAFLKGQDAKIITINFFSLEADDEISETIAISDLKQRAVDLYYADEGNFYFSHNNYNFNYDSSVFIVPQELT